MIDRLDDVVVGIIIMLISRNTLGLAAEFAVASELCRRNVYAQLTLGHQKRTDLLIFGANDKISYFGLSVVGISISIT
jgi:hypothetical protein